MTDRCITNTVVNQQLNSLQSDNNDLNTFFCGVHPLDSFAKAADKALKAFDHQHNISASTFSHRSSSSAQALIYAIAKVFHKDGSGVPHELKVFLESKGILKTIVHYFVGERFHIYFHNGGAVYFVAPILKEFFSKVWGTPNRLLQAVNQDLSSEPLLDACRALGLLGKQFTAPWLKVTMAERPVLELNKFYAMALEKLSSWSIDASDLINGVGSLDGTTPQNDKLYDKLVLATKSNARVKCLLEAICTNISEVARRQLKDQLPGGRFANPDDHLWKVAASCVGNNISGERVFARLDASIKRAPVASMQYHESKICYQGNATGEWLESKSMQERGTIIQSARKLARKDVVAARKHQEYIHQEKAAQLRQKQEDLSQKEDRKRILNEHLIVDITRLGGLWSTTSTMEA